MLTIIFAIKYFIISVNLIATSSAYIIRNIRFDKLLRYVLLIES